MDRKEALRKLAELYAEKNRLVQQHMAQGFYSIAVQYSLQARGIELAIEALGFDLNEAHKVYKEVHEGCS